jgi:thiamine pyrophosphate-dependent acetolactate synthase large subunit-like protein
MRSADRAIVFGLRIAYMENSGLPPFWGATCQHVQMQSCRENVSLTLINTVDEVIGSPKLMLRQMIDCLKDLGVDGPPEKWNDWRKFVVDTKADYWDKALSRQDAMKGKTPLHPDLAGRLTAEFLGEELNNEVITIIDGFTASSFFTDWQKVVKSRYNVDASETIGIGHAPGLAIGAGWPPTARCRSSR